jgi:2,3,4,5-tetrahydropyridine-2-carboxylate N-succinyltransferase
MSARELIEAAYADRDRLGDARQAVFETIERLDRGEVRVAEKTEGAWTVNEWVKQAILLYFLLTEVQVMQSGPFQYHDKIPTKQNLAEAGVRVVPPGTVRYGAFCEPGVIVMPGYVNIGAYVAAGTMVDTWATVGSCAQIGKHVHLSGGVGIGGVLEPPNARPVIIEDGAFIGSRCIVTEGTLVEEGAVLAANVSLTRSTPIIDITGDQPVEHRGRVPARSVVVPGTRPKEFPGGTAQLACAYIIGERKESTDERTSLNEALRTFEVPV